MMFKHSSNYNFLVCARKKTSDVTNNCWSTVPFGFRTKTTFCAFPRSVFTVCTLNSTTGVRGQGRRTSPEKGGADYRGGAPKMGGACSISRAPKVCSVGATGGDQEQQK
jgi:hypothetical protein